MNKISEIKSGQSFDELNVKVLELSDVREFSKFGRSGKVCNAKVSDDSGSISLTLWNEQVDQVSVGDMINIKNGFAKEWNGNLQISIGKFGSLSVGGASEDSDASSSDSDVDVEEEKVDEE